MGHAVGSAASHVRSELDRHRRSIRASEFTGTTSGLCPGIIQANLVVLPASLAPEFRAFCDRNPKPCPLVEQTEPGATSAPRSAPAVDLRTDVPRFRVYRDGDLVEEPLDLLHVWRDDFVTFLLGCSFSFEHALERAGVPLRHRQEGKTVPMYVTGEECAPAGVFGGPLVVSMRPVRARDVSRVRDITRSFPHAHGEPVHTGDPKRIGIANLDEPDFGDAVTVHPGEEPVFWACGVTPQAVARAARLELVITHAPGRMLLTDLYEDQSFPGRFRLI